MAKDRFKIPLKCPECGKEGEANCEQEDGWAFMKGNHFTQVNKVTSGFSRVNEKSGWSEDINFICNDCGKLAAK